MSAGTVQRAFELAPECRTIDELRSKLINERCANIDAHLKDSPARSEQAVEASGLRSASKGFERLTHVSSWNLIAPRRLGDLPVIPCRHLGRSCVRGRPLTLTLWRKLGAVLITLSAIVGAAAATASAIADWVR
jgi:hypothetical protein